VLGPYVPSGLVTEVLARNELTNDPWTLAALQICAGYPGLSGVDAVDSAAIIQNALARFQMLGDRWGASLALSALAELAAWSDRLELSSELLGQALSIAAELDSDEEAALLLCRRADLQLHLGNLGAASDDYGQALLLAERAGLPDSAAAARIGLARSARYDGNFDTARKLAQAALSGCPAGWVGADLARTEILSELAAIVEAEGHPAETHS
jgi:tetratricopeptide (TPR) repeat protein